MTPCDQRARRVATFFEAALNCAHAHAWDSNQEVLLIDNRITLHARAQVSPDDEGRVLRRVAFRFGRGE
ncbi:TauD/TfdA family dioxygenase [Rhodococcus kroppenstedtii]|nr:TauD/TfdA family dioxygenase [Rhodococcus kroppenstedtii]